jgi:hypothetical protein
VTTVSGPQKAALARAAGAHYVVNYRDTDAASAIREAAPDGVDMIVEVAPAVNAALDQAVAAPNAVVAANADTGGDTLTVSVRELMFANLRWQGVVVYTVPEVAKAYAVADVAAAVADGALRAGEEAGLPLHRFPLAQTQDAHAAVQNNAVGKVMRGDRPILVVLPRDRRDSPPHRAEPYRTAASQRRARSRRPQTGGYLMDAHGFVGSRNEERRGKMLEKFQAAGGVLLDPVQDDDLQIFAAWERRG